MEIVVLRALSDVPGVIRLLDAFHTRRDYFLVMERVVGMTTLGSYLFTPEHAQGLRTDVARLIFREVLTILARIHDRGFTHRDLTTGNILIDANTFRVMLIDFGISEPLGSPNGSRSSKELCYVPFMFLGFRESLHEHLI